MKVYFADRDRGLHRRSRWQRLEPRRRWSLDGIACPTCGETWGYILAFPSINLAGHPAEPLFRSQPGRTAVSYSEALRRWQLVSSLFPSDLPLIPWSAHLGPLLGKASGHFGDFVWPSIGNVTLRTETLERLASAAVRLPESVPVQMTYASHDPPVLRELELPIAARWSPAVLSLDSVWQCDECGRRTIRNPGQIVLDAASIPDGCDVFRWQDLTTRVLVTERLVEAAKELRLTDVAFHEVALFSNNPATPVHRRAITVVDVGWQLVGGVLEDQLRAVGAPIYRMESGVAGQAWQVTSEVLPGSQHCREVSTDERLEETGGYWVLLQDGVSVELPPSAFRGGVEIPVSPNGYSVIGNVFRAPAEVEGNAMVYVWDSIWSRFEPSRDVPLGGAALVHGNRTRSVVLKPKPWPDL